MKRYAAVKVPSGGRLLPWEPDAGTEAGVGCAPFSFGRSPSLAFRFRFQAGSLGSTGRTLFECLPRKEVIQPHLPVRLPCYDFTPLTLHTFGASPLAVGPATSGADDSGGVTGGVYKARERIHRGVLIRDY